jgi:hypothetical protein
MNNSPIHAKDEILSILVKVRIKVIGLAPHTTPIFQMLDCRDLKIAKNDRSTFY